MDFSAAAEERSIHDGLRRRLDEVNSVAKAHLSPIQDHINFTLQQAYFKCAYECFDRRMKQEQIGSCVEHCSTPVLTAQNLVENEMAKLQEALSRSMRVCQDRFEASKLQPDSKNGLRDFESCMNQSVDDSLNTIPLLAKKLKGQLSINDE